MLAWPRMARWLSTALPVLLATQTAAQVAPSPHVDLDGLGQIAIAGNFDAVALYEYLGQRQGYNTNGTQSVFASLPSGLLNVLASSDATIQAMCPFVLRNGTYAGLIVAGNFTSLAGVDARSIALVNTDTLSIQPNPGLEGSIHTVYCDRNSQTVYVGGTFEAAASTNAIAWVADGSWANLNFEGFDGPVYSITGAPDGHIIFGGAFSGLKNGTTSSRNATDRLQLINTGNAAITSSANSTSGQNAVCAPSSGSTPWLLRDNTPGSWQATFRYGFEPARLRLWNANQDGRGTRTFRFTALPINGILNLTYINENGNRAYCDATCPLPNRAAYQDFEFVNVVGMNSFRIDVSEWYGSGGGLAGVEVYQEDIFAYAIDRNSQPTCGASETLSTASVTGSWYETPSGQGTLDYLTVVTGPTTVQSTEIVFEPDVKVDGNYSVIVYTPGCRADSSCSARAVVNVTGQLTRSGATNFATQVFQTNDFDKFDPVYSGRIEARTGSFVPQITIRPSGLQTDQLVVASKIRLTLTNTTGGLNGIFEFDPSLAMVDSDLSQSAINKAGNVLEPGAQVNALVTHGNRIYSGGRFAHDEFTNIMAFENNGPVSLPNGGLNGDVASMYSSAEYLYVGGNFSGANNNGPAGLTNVASYNYADNRWVALGAGLDGSVEVVAPLQLYIGSSNETAISFSGSFSNIVTTGADRVPANGFAVWLPSRNAWLSTLDIGRQIYSGQLLAFAILPNGTWLGAGTLTSLGDSISGAVGLRSASDGRARLQQLPIEIASGSMNTSSSLAKRDIINGQNVTGVTVAIWDTSHQRNLTIFGGQFSATGNNSADIENLLIYDGSTNTVTGLPAGIEANSTFLSLAVSNDILIAGGEVSGTVNNSQVRGIVMYDLGSKVFRAVQPAALSGASVVVNAIAPRPSSNVVYVGGSFEETSQRLACRSVCAYDLSSNQWTTVGGQLSGNVTALYWASNDELLAAGNLSVSGNMTMLARYSTQQQSWSAQASSGIPGGVTAFAPGTRNADHIWVAGTATNGSTYLMEVDGNNFRPVVGGLQPGSIIRGLKLIYLTEDHGDSQYLNRDEALLVSGQLNLTDYGPVSVALFNGSAFTPFVLSSSTDGSPGIVNGIFSENTDNFRAPGFRHSRGIAVLVALCAALGTIFLIVLIGILANKIQQRRNGYNTLPSVPYADKNSNLNRVPPESLFGTLGKRNPGAPTV